ncbi:MAG TPA: hypothetical protein VK892_19765 [Pyrinomonadaceae bacterium]|nr:hypothetical protein [Pyrinomonadaceae bacterium]
MNNLTQTQLDAKKAYLDRQQEEMLALYKQADTNERNAIIKQIDSFLSVVSQEQKIFWLKFRRKLEVLNEKSILFPLGQVFMTVGAREAMEKANQQPFEFLQRHQTGDWGLVCKEDAEENELSVKEGFRILSAYKTAKDVKIWIITESDRSSSTILLPEEY